MEESEITPRETNGTKRKHEGRHEVDGHFKALISVVRPLDDPKAVSLRILDFERQIIESRRNYNSICTILDYAEDDGLPVETQYLAFLSLCRVFCRLMVTRTMSKTTELSGKNHIVVDWLRKCYFRYETVLLRTLVNSDFQDTGGLIEIIKHLMKEETRSIADAEELFWRQGIFSRILRYLVELKDTKHNNVSALKTAIKMLANGYLDVRFFTFAVLGRFATLVRDTTELDTIISTLGMIDALFDNINEVDVLADRPRNKRIAKMQTQKQRAQETWIAILRQHLNTSQRKTLLTLMPSKISPCFSQLEILMDFLTDSFDAGGSTSLLALSELFHLIQEKNLDYPQFYQKLYSLLDSSVLHSKHRSQLFRLVHEFLASTHLPGALVASFIKRLSRLCLYSPPSGIIATVPWIYNLFKLHPICTFMIHKAPVSQMGEYSYKSVMEKDPFRAYECDPMATYAEESSLWEIESLQSHYHPNVATMAKIISEQFTKQSYALEDFLGHSYCNMLESELCRSINRIPAVEYAVPKWVYSLDSQDERNNFLVNVWSFD